MPRRSLPAPTPCPVARSVDAIGDRWSLLIVRDAFDGLRRFSDFQRSLGVARNILADRLRKLVEAGILETEAAAEGSAYQAYRLTAKGEDLFTTVVALRQWGERHLFAAGEPHSVLLETRTGQPLAPLLARSTEGAVLAPAATAVRKLAEAPDLEAPATSTGRGRPTTGKAKGPAGPDTQR